MKVNADHVFINRREVSIWQLKSKGSLTFIRKTTFIPIKDTSEDYLVGTLFQSAKNRWMPESVRG